LVSAPNAPNGSGQDGRTATSDFYETPDNLAVQARAATAVIDKDIYSLFTSHGRELVRSHGWTDLYVCGIATESCVLKTAADAFEQGDLTPWIIEDASASHAGPAAHDAGIAVAARFIGPNQIIRIADLPAHVRPPQRAA